MQPEGLRFYTSVGVDKFWPGWPEEFCTLSEYFDFWYICLYKSYSQSWRNDRWPNITKHLQGDPGLKGVFATRVSGSADLYQVLLCFFFTMLLF